MTISMMDAMIPMSQAASTPANSTSSSSQSSSNSDFEKLLQDNSSSNGTDSSQSDAAATQTETSDSNGSETQNGGEEEITDTQRALMAGLMMVPEMMYRTVEDVGELDFSLEQNLVEETPEIMIETEVELNLGDQPDSELLTQLANPEMELELNLEVTEVTTEELVIPEEMILEVEPEQVIETVELPKEVTTVEEPEMEESDEPEEVTETKSSQAKDSDLEKEDAVSVVKPTDDEQPESDGEADAELLGQNQEGKVLFEKVESTPIKVAETVNTQDPDMDTQMAKIIQDASDAGESTVVIRMSPESLGSVTAQITQTAEGTLHVVLQAADDVATALLKNHVGQLVQALQATGQTVTVEIAQSEEAEQSNQDHEKEEQNQKEHHQDKDDTQEEQEFVYNDDFMQQLRLGLTGFNLEVL